MSTPFGEIGKFFLLIFIINRRVIEPNRFDTYNFLYSFFQLSPDFLSFLSNPFLVILLLHNFVYLTESEVSSIYLTNQEIGDFARPLIPIVGTRYTQILKKEILNRENQSSVSNVKPS